MYSCAGCALLNGAVPGGKWGWRSSQCSDPESCALLGAAAGGGGVPHSDWCTWTGHPFLSQGALNAEGRPCLLFYPLFLISSPSMGMRHKIYYPEPLRVLQELLSPHRLDGTCF